MAMASLFESVASAVVERLRMSEPRMSGAARIHHIENCVRCSMSESGGPEGGGGLSSLLIVLLVPSGGDGCASHFLSVGQPTTRKSGSLYAPGPVALLVLYATTDEANSMISPMPALPWPLNTRVVMGAYAPSPQNG